MIPVLTLFFVFQSIFVYANDAPEMRMVYSFRNVGFGSELSTMAYSAFTAYMYAAEPDRNYNISWCLNRYAHWSFMPCALRDDHDAEGDDNSADSDGDNTDAVGLGCLFDAEHPFTHVCPVNWARLPSIRDPNGIAPPSMKSQRVNVVNDVGIMYRYDMTFVDACHWIQRIFRPNARLRAAYDEKAKRLALDGPFVALHIRRGDSAKEKGAWIPLRTFWSAAKRVVASLGWTPTTERRATVYIATDTAEVVDVMKFLTTNDSSLYRVVFDDEQVRFSFSARFEIDRQLTLIDSAIAHNVRSKHAFEFLTDIMAFTKATAFVGTLGSNVGGIVAELRNGTKCTFLDVERDQDILHVTNVSLEDSFRKYLKQAPPLPTRFERAPLAHFWPTMHGFLANDKHYGLNKVSWFRQALFPTHGQDAVSFNSRLMGKELALIGRTFGVANRNDSEQ